MEKKFVVIGKSVELSRLFIEKYSFQSHGQICTSVNNLKGISGMRVILLDGWEERPDSKEINQELENISIQKNPTSIVMSQKDFEILINQLKRFLDIFDTNIV